MRLEKVNISDWADWNNPIVEEGLKKPKNEKTIERIAWIVEQAEGRTLDLGCGDGEALINIATSFPNEHHLGIDYSQKAVEKATLSAGQLGLENVQFARLAICDLLPGNRERLQEPAWILPYDTVILGEVLEHVRFPFLALKTAEMYLFNQSEKKNGKLIVTVPSKYMPSTLHLRSYFRSGLEMQLSYFFKEVWIGEDETFFYATATNA